MLKTRNKRKLWGYALGLTGFMVMTSACGEESELAEYEFASTEAEVAEVSKSESGTLEKEYAIAFDLALKQQSTQKAIAESIVKTEVELFQLDEDKQEWVRCGTEIPEKDDILYLNALVYDRSGSTTNALEEWKHIQNASLSAIDRAEEVGAEMSLVASSTASRVKAEMGLAYGEMSDILLADAPSNGWSTYYDGIALALGTIEDRIALEAKDNYRDFCRSSRMSVTLISDGHETNNDEAQKLDNGGQLHTIIEDVTENKIKGRKVPVNTISLETGDGQVHSTLEKIAQLTKGQHRAFVGAEDLEDAVDAVSSFVPNSKRICGKLHKELIKADRPVKLKAKYRAISVEGKVLKESEELREVSFKK